MRLATMTRTCLLAALLLTIAGCGATSTAQSTAKPTVRIISPISRTQLTPSMANVLVRVAISHFTLVPGPAGPEKAGSGQVWIYVNGHIVSHRGSSTATLALTPGTYSLKAVLATNGKPVASSAPIVVSIPNPVSCVPTPQPSRGLKAGTMTLFCRGLPVGDAVLGLVAGPGGDLWFPVEEFTSANVVHFGIGRIMPSGVITVFSHGLPAGGWPVKLVTGPDGNLWFTMNSTGANGAGAIGRITPSGVITVFSRGLPAGGLAWDTQLLVGPGGDLWFPVSGGIGRIAPSGAITVFTSPALPAGSVVGHLVTVPGGDLWFPVYPTQTNAGGGSAIAIGRITPSGAITVFSHGLPAGSLAGGDSNYGRKTGAGHLVVGPNGNLWFTATPTNTGSNGANGIGRITPSGTITVFSDGLPAGSQLYSLVAGSDGNLWFTVNRGFGTGGIGRITPSGTITVFSHDLPAGGFTRDLMTGPDGNLWFTVSNGSANAVGRITPSGTITLFNSQALAAGGGAGNLVTGPDGNLWFLVPPVSGCGVATTNAIGRIVP